MNAIACNFKKDVSQNARQKQAHLILDTGFCLITDLINLISTLIRILENQFKPKIVLTMMEIKCKDICKFNLIVYILLNAVFFFVTTHTLSWHFYLITD